MNIHALFNTLSSFVITILSGGFFRCSDESPAVQETLGFDPELGRSLEVKPLSILAQESYGQEE